jgi:hypothetical protein
MQIKRDFAGSTDMWPTSAGGQLIEVANLTGFTVIIIITNQPTISTKQSPSFEANISSPSQEIPHIL